MVTNQTTFKAPIHLRHRTNIMILIIVTSFVLMCYGIENVVSYYYTLLMFCFGNHFFPKRIRYFNFVSFEFYLLIAIIIFSTQYSCLPDYQGLSGPEGGIGTDDIRYYEKITDVPLKVSSTAGWIESFTFSTFLRFIYPFSIVSPLNIVIVNLLGIAYLPGLTYLLTIRFNNNSQIAHRAACLTLFCPSLWSNGLIIMRDAWTVSLTVLIFILIINKKYLQSTPPIALLCYLRFGSVAFVFLGILIIIKYQFFNKSTFRKISYWGLIVICIIFFICSINYLSYLTGGKVEVSLFRETFISMLKSNDENGIITKIAQMSPVIRTPLLFLFFFFTPFLNFNIYTLGVFNIRTMLDTLLTACWFLFICKYIFEYIYVSIMRCNNLRILTWISIYFALALSIISLQVRHKIIMMPFFAIMAAIGMSIPKTKYNQLFSLLAIITALVELIFALR